MCSRWFHVPLALWSARFWELQQVHGCKCQLVGNLLSSKSPCGVWQVLWGSSEMGLPFFFLGRVGTVSEYSVPTRWWKAALKRWPQALFPRTRSDWLRVWQLKVSRMCCFIGARPFWRGCQTCGFIRSYFLKMPRWWAYFSLFLLCSYPPHPDLILHLHKPWSRFVYFIHLCFKAALISF